MGRPPVTIPAEHYETHPSLFPQPDAAATARAAALNDYITCGEVKDAVARLSNNKSAGFDCIPAELLTVIQ